MSPTRSTGLTALLSLSLGALLPAIFLPWGFPAFWLLLALGLALMAAWRFPEPLPANGFEKNSLRIVALCFAAYLASFVITTAVHGSSLRELDKAIRYGLGILLLLGLARTRVEPSVILSFVVLAALSAAGYAVFDKLAHGAERVGGFMNEIQFGVLATLVAGINIIMSIDHYRKSFRSARLFAAAAAVALGAAVMSGSLTTMLSLCAVPLAMLIARWRLPSLRSLLLGLLTVAAVIGVLIQMRAPIVSRVSDAINEVSRYEQYKSGVDTFSSNGARIENFHNAWGIFLQAPLLGVGNQGYQAMRREQVKRGELTAYSGTLGVAHNEYLDALAKRGLVGLAGLLALLFGPVWVFIRVLRRHAAEESQAWAVAGIVVCLGLALAALTQNVLTHSSGANFMVLCVPLFLRLALQRPRPQAAKTGQRLAP